VLVTDANGGRARKLVRGDIYSGSPAWSPSGKLIAFSGADVHCKSHTGECSAIFVVKPNGTGLRRLPPYWTINEEPSWSPNGRQIAYVGSRVEQFQSSGRGSVYVIDADGTHRRRILDHPQADDIEPLVRQPTR
jgi:Tol biopolymer transport system component